MQAKPDSIILLAPTPWGLTDPTSLELGRSQLIDTYQATWSEPITITVSAPTEYVIHFPEEVTQHSPEVYIYVDEPIPQLTEAEGYALQPLAPTERVRIEQHTSLWRFVIPDGSTYGMANATLGAKLMEALCRCQSPAIFLPGSIRLHPVGVVRTLTARYHAPDAIANLFISAWHEESIMATRGLTSLGLPELATIIDSGHNAAYFRLMDLATEMMLAGEPYQLGYQIELGHERYLITEPKEKVVDKENPVAGFYGYQYISPV